MGLLGGELLPNLSYLELCDVYVTPHDFADPFAARVGRVVPPLKDLRVISRRIHNVALPEISRLLALFGSVERLHLCGYPTIQPGYEQGRFDGGTIHAFRPKCITVSDPGRFAALFFKLCTSPTISSVDSVVIGAGYSQPTLGGLSHFIEAIGPQLKHLTCVHMLQCISCEPYLL